MGLNWDFLLGFIWGFLVAGIFGFLLQQRRVERAKMGARGRPQTITLETQQTPDQVVRTSKMARLHYFLWTIALVLILLGFAFLTLKVCLVL